MAGRVKTGIEGLDEVIEGGFPKGSLILLAGEPGTGKTVFSAQFLAKGAELSEPGVYVSFAEAKDTLIENLSRHLGIDFKKFEAEDKLTILDFTVMKEEGVSTLLGAILGEVEALGAERLVLDSFSAMAQALESPIDVRIVAHTILGKIARGRGVTTIIIEEAPIGRAEIGFGLEEFVADGVLRLRAGELEGRPFRELEISKLRGTKLSERKLTFTLEGGFRIFTPFRCKPIERPEHFKPIPDPPDKYSMGSGDLDLMLGGGLPKGSSMLLEVSGKISTFEYHLLVVPFAANFMAQGRGIVVIPSSGVDTEMIVDRALSYGAAEDEVNRLLRIYELPEPYAKREPYTFTVKGRDINEDLEEYVKIVKALEEATGQPILAVVGLDTLASLYGEEACVKALSVGATKVKKFGVAALYILKPGYGHLAEKFSPIADVHLRLVREHGCLLLYGVKPRTGLYAVEMDTSKGYPLPKLTPIL